MSSGDRQEGLIYCREQCGMSNQSSAGTTQTFSSTVSKVYMLIDVLFLCSYKGPFSFDPFPSSLPLSKFTEKDCSGAKSKALKSDGPRFRFQLGPFLPL